MTARHGCIAATVAIWTFLVAVAFILVAWLRQPEATRFEAATAWSVYGYLIAVATVGTVDAWRRR